MVVLASLQGFSGSGAQVMVRRAMRSSLVTVGSIFVSEVPGEAVESFLGESSDTIEDLATDTNDGIEAVVVEEE